MKLTPRVRIADLDKLKLVKLSNKGSDFCFRQFLLLATSKNTTHVKSGQKVTQNNHLALQSKYVPHCVKSKILTFSEISPQDGKKDLAREFCDNVATNLFGN
jgi:hypothetical protein